MEKGKIVLCDTNIIIEMLKGNPAVYAALDKIGFSRLSISSITKMELLVGAFNKAEIRKINKALSDVEMLHPDADISITALELLEKYSKSHGLLIPDAIIAASSITSGYPLFTLNVKDFRFIEGLILY